MKIYLMLFLFLGLRVFGQSPVIDIYGAEDYGKVNGAYYKDVTAFQNQYIGTWVYSNGGKILKITFVPKNSFHVTNDVKDYYADFVIGEFQYIENGNEKANTLSNLGQAYTNIDDYSIVSMSRKHKTSYPLCDECGDNEYRLSMRFNEPSRRNIWGGISNKFVIRRYVQNGQVKLKVQFVYTGNGLERLDSMDGPPANINTFSVPYGEYILTKQQ